MSRIYKTFYGSHIDLDKLLSVSAAQFDNRMGFGGWFVSFKLVFQLQDEPVIYERELTEAEYTYQPIDGRYCHYIRLIDGTLNPHIPEDHTKILAVQNLQKQVDELVRQWTNEPETGPVSSGLRCDFDPSNPDKVTPI